MKALPEKDIKFVQEVVGPLKNKHVLLAGAHGFLGSWIKAALEEFCFVRSLDITSGFDITDRTRIGLVENADFIIHAAGFASPKVYNSVPLRTIDVTIDGTRNLLNLAKRTDARMLFFSSSEVYGNPIQVPTEEWDVGRVSFRGPRACYDESKRLAETLCQVYFEQYKTKIITVRPFNVYGPGMSLNDGRAVAAFTKAGINNEIIEVYGDGSQTRTYCYVADAVRGFLQALQYGQAGRVYNIGNTFPEISASSLAGTIKILLGSKSEVRVRGDSPGDYPGDEPRRRCPNIDRAKAEIGFNPQVTLDDGLKRYIDWVREQ